MFVEQLYKSLNSSDSWIKYLNQESKHPMWMLIRSKPFLVWCQSILFVRHLFILQCTVEQFSVNTGYLNDPRLKHWRNVNACSAALCFLSTVRRSQRSPLSSGHKLIRTWIRWDEVYGVRSGTCGPRDAADCGAGTWKWSQRRLSLALLQPSDINLGL